MRVGGQGEIRNKDYSIFYSGNENPGFKGTGFYLDKKARDCILAFEPVDARLCYIRLKGKFQNISLISVYAPTEESEEIIKDEFYDKLSDYCSKISKYDKLIILGDCKAQVGRDDYTRNNMGKHSLHEKCNDNGTRLCNFAASNNMWISSVSFPHKQIHKQTWVIPGNRGTTQIDHVLIDKRHATSILDVRTYRGAVCGSEHFLVIAQLRHRISTVNNKNNYRKIRWNTDNIATNTEKLQSYQNALKPQLSYEDQTEENDINSKWNFIKNAVIVSAEEHIGRRSNEPNKDWFDEQCKIMVNAKNDARRQYLAVPTRQNKHVYEQKRKETNKLSMFYLEIP